MAVRHRDERLRDLEAHAAAETASRDHAGSIFPGFSQERHTLLTPPPGTMEAMTTTYIIVNLFLALAAFAGVGILVRLAHRLPQKAPLSDHRWGTGGDPYVPSEPLPLHQVAEHEDERALVLAA
jgi:hypothetical protein